MKLCSKLKAVTIIAVTINLFCCCHTQAISQYNQYTFGIRTNQLVGLNLLSSVYLLSSEVMAANVTTKPVPKKRSKTNFIYSDQSIEHPDINNSSKVMIDGGLFANQKFDKVENLNKKTPELKLLSPMERFPSSKKYADDDDIKYIPYKLSDINHFQEPCGNTNRGRVHFDAEAEQVAIIEWEVKEEVSDGLCILKLADGPDDQEYDILWPRDHSAASKGINKGYFPCGRAKTIVESKEIKFPANVTCDSCILQMIWKYKRGTKTYKQYYCSDIEILGGKIEDCSGQCMNGGMCLNGACQCRKGFQGNFCQIKEYVSDSTSYTKYLKYFLFFIIMILAIVVLMFGGYLLYRAAEKVIESMRSQNRDVPDPDDISGPGNPQQYQASRFGKNMDITGF